VKLHCNVTNLLNDLGYLHYIHVIYLTHHKAEFKDHHLSIRTYNSLSLCTWL